MEAAAAVKGRKNFAEMTLEEMDAIWNSVKKQIKFLIRIFPTIGIPARYLFITAAWLYTLSFFSPTIFLLTPALKRLPKAYSNTSMGRKVF